MTFFSQALALCTGLFLFGSGDNPVGGFLVKLGLVGILIAGWFIFISQISRGGSSRSL